LTPLLLKSCFSHHHLSYLPAALFWADHPAPRSQRTFLLKSESFFPLSETFPSLHCNQITNSKAYRAPHILALPTPDFLARFHLFPVFRKTPLSDLPAHTLQPWPQLVLLSECSFPRSSHGSLLLTILTSTQVSSLQNILSMPLNPVSLLLHFLGLSFS
jgi:hypothetical protein